MEKPKDYSEAKLGIGIAALCSICFGIWQEAVSAGVFLFALLLFSTFFAPKE
jgi:hypothetical protein